MDHNDAVQRVMSVLLIAWLMIVSHPILTTVSGGAAELHFVPAVCNPVLVPGEPGTWDGGVVFLPKVFRSDGTIYLFYTATAGRGAEMGPPAIGLAFSSDGLTFARFAGNPILEPDGDGFDAYGMSEGVPFFDGTQWVLLYNGRASEGHGPGRSIGRATATDPRGLWCKDSAPILTVGPDKAWDSGFVSPNCVVATNEGYVLYYSGGTSFDSEVPKCLGLATSPDGLVWTKYNDPETMEAAFAESDPILELGPEASFDALAAWEASVWRTDSGWAMIYEGIGPATSEIGLATQLGCAASSDGIDWQKCDENPILQRGIEPLAESFGVEVPSVVVIDDLTYLYYGYGLHIGAIGVAVGMILMSPSE